MLPMASLSLRQLRSGRRSGSATRGNDYERGDRGGEWNGGGNDNGHLSRDRDRTTNANNDNGGGRRIAGVVVHPSLGRGRRRSASNHNGGGKGEGRRQQWGEDRDWMRMQQWQRRQLSLLRLATWKEHGNDERGGAGGRRRGWEKGVRYPHATLEEREQRPGVGGGGGRRSASGGRRHDACDDEDDGGRRIIPIYDRARGWGGGNPTPAREGWGGAGGRSTARQRRREDR